MKAFDKAFFGHAGLIFGNAARAFTLGLGMGKPSVPFSGPAAGYAQDIARLSAGFGLCADAAMASLGSELKKTRNAFRPPGRYPFQPLPCLYGA